MPAEARKHKTTFQALSSHHDFASWLREIPLLALVAKPMDMTTIDHRIAADSLNIHHQSILVRSITVSRAEPIILVLSCMSFAFERKMLGASLKKPQFGDRAAECMQYKLQLPGRATRMGRGSTQLSGWRNVKKDVGALKNVFGARHICLRSSCTT